MFSKKNLIGAVAGGLFLSLGVAHAELDVDPKTLFDEVDRDDARRLVEGTCLNCHGQGVMGAAGIGAPAWPHLVDARGFEGLTMSVINGRGAMPPRGGRDVSDEEVAAAVLYMLVESGIDKDDL